MKIPIPVDTNSYDYKYNKTLNEDVKLKCDEYGDWDLDMDNGDYINTTGLKTLQNACIIAIMTRFGELIGNPTYEEFGCRVHELIKDNKTKLTFYKLETYITDVLQQMRRISLVNYVNITENEVNSYTVNFSVTSINDEIVEGSVTL